MAHLLHVLYDDGAQSQILETGNDAQHINGTVSNIHHNIYFAVDVASLRSLCHNNAGSRAYGNANSCAHGNANSHAHGNARSHAHGSARVRCGAGGDWGPLLT